MKTIKATILALALVAVSFGCATTSNPDRTANTARAIATSATTIALADHPEWRDGFVKAATDLEVISTRETIDTADIVAIVQRLPVKELRGRHGAIYIAGATLLINEAGGISVPIERYGGLQKIALALAQGIRQGLE